MILVCATDRNVSASVTKDNRDSRDEYVYEKKGAIFIRFHIRKESRLGIQFSHRREYFRCKERRFPPRNRIKIETRSGTNVRYRSLVHYRGEIILQHARPFWMRAVSLAAFLTIRMVQYALIGTLAGVATPARLCRISIVRRVPDSVLLIIQSPIY